MSQQSGSWFLLEKTGPRPNTTVPLTGATITLGRASDNHVVVDDYHVSRHHARLVWRESGFEIEDLRSGNGTWVNGQRITQPTPVRKGDQIGLGQQVVFELRTQTVGGESPRPVPQPQVAAPAAEDGRGFLLFGVGGLLGAGIVAAVLLVGGGIVCLLASGAGDETPTATLSAVESTGADDATLVPVEIAIPETPTPSGEPTPGAQTGTPMPPFELARRATVFIVAFLDENGDDAYTGSGSIVDTRGYVLTNYHVVRGTIKQYVGLNSARQDAPPEEFYRAQIVTFDQGLDLALLQIAGDVDGNPLKGTLILPIMEVGDSDDVNLGDAITILGFPALGEDTLTLTKGTVAGFVDDSDLGIHRGWIKTDAEISSGNSGGVVIDAEGRLIGVPTQVTYNTETIGALGLVRPINLAKDLLEKIP